MPEPITPPTPRPAEGQGPWFDEITGRWWVVTDRPQDALAVLDAVDADIFPRYYGWSVKVEPVQIAWSESFDGEEVCIEEQPYETEATVEAWRVTVTGL